MRIEFLYWDECPSHEDALERLRAVLRDEGLRDADVDLRIELVTTEEGALRRRFVGSPTILIEGVDVAPPGDAEPLGLTCRVYWREDGRASPLPSVETLRRAIRAARGGGRP